MNMNLNEYESGWFLQCIKFLCVFLCKVHSAAQETGRAKLTLSRPETCTSRLAALTPSDSHRRHRFTTRPTSLPIPGEIATVKPTCWTHSDPFRLSQGQERCRHTRPIRPDERWRASKSRSRRSKMHFCFQTHLKLLPLFKYQIRVQSCSSNLIF